MPTHNLRIDELARRTGSTERNIRAHHRADALERVSGEARARLAWRSAA